MAEPIAYLNGRYVPVSQATLHVFDLGIVGGTAVSEMARTFRHSAFLLDEHLSRLAQSLEAVGFRIELTIAELKSICEKVVAENCGQIPPQHDLGVIIFVTAGPNPTYVGQAGTFVPTVCIHTFPLPFELWAQTYETGLHLVTVGLQSIPDNVIDPRIKHRSRLHWHLAAREARKIDPAAMAILSDGNGLLTETATGSLCVVDGATIITPAAHVLQGISCGYLADVASSLGLGFVHGPVTREDLAHADEAFLTSTPHCLLPITRLDGSPVGSGAPGPLFRRLIAAWSDRVGLDIVGQMRQGAVDRLSAG